MSNKRKFIGVLATLTVVLGTGSACIDPVEVEWDWDGDTRDYPRYDGGWAAVAGDLHIEGTVYVDSTSQTIPDAIVVATRTTSLWSDSTVTDSVGRFRLIVPPAAGSTVVDCNEVRLEAYADGYEPAPRREIWAYTGECPGGEFSIHLSPDG